MEIFAGELGPPPETQPPTHEHHPLDLTVETMAEAQEYEVETKSLSL
jgi:hypothetical protein